jgi:cytoplasmic iron level regulating protein YaaA (DUF328/UPF0246 family)
MLLVTAPSKTQETIDRTYPTYTLPLLLNMSCELVTRLREFSLQDLCSLMKMSRKLGESTFERIEDFILPLTLENATQALFTFQGDAYSSLTPDLYNEEELQHAQQSICILSGLYGILRPLDLMHPYRLEMGTRLSLNKHKNLYEFWGNTITEHLNQMCSTHNDKTLINLASSEYSRTIKTKILEPRMITATFKERKGDTYKTIPIHSKRARGMMIHYVIRNQLTAAEELQQFTAGGYSFAAALSTDDTWIFTRG